MDTIRIVDAHIETQADRLSSPTLTRDRLSEGVRILDEFELVLAGGGDDLPLWP